MERKKYRVVQWMTGHTGSDQLKKIIQHPCMELVGVYVHSPEKVGVDAGDIAGTEKTGVFATNQLEDILALKPDCVCYSTMTKTASIDEMCALLRNGSNIVTISTDYAYRYPKMMEPEIREKLEAACREGSSTLFGGGMSPGFIHENLLLTFLNQFRELKSVTIIEFGSMVHRAEKSPEMIAMMFGQKPEIMKMAGTALTDMQKVGFGPSLSMVMDAVGLQLDNITSECEYPTARHTFKLANTVIEAGTTASYQGTVTGWRNGQPLIRFCYNWYATEDLENEILPMRETGHRIIIEGDVKHIIDIYDEPDWDTYLKVQAGYNGNCSINSIIPVIKAEPGIRTYIELPPVIPYFGE